MQARVRRSATKNERAAIWAHLQMHTQRDCPTVAYSKRSEPLLFNKSTDSVWSMDGDLARAEVPELAETLERWRTYTPSTGDVIRRYEFVTFHQSYSYEEFVEGIKPTLEGEPDLPAAYERCVGITLQRSLAANPKPVPPEVRPQFEAMQRKLAEGACGQQREACEKDRSSRACKAFLGRYGH